MTSAQEEKQMNIGYLVTLGIGLLFLAWGLFLFFLVGDKGPAEWYYGSVPAVPGQSEYSTSAAKDFYFNATSPEKQGRVERQHVMGRENAPESVEKIPGE